MSNLTTQYIAKVKICCIGSIEEATMAIHHGASAIGLVSEMPSGPGAILEDLIADIVSRVPPSISTFLLTSKQDPDAIIAQHQRTRASTIQICDRLDSGAYRELRRALSSVALIQVIHVTGPEAIDEAVSVAPYANGILLDSGNQSLPVKELGGTGRTHNWSISKTIRESVDVPVFLAGGLTPENVGSAIRQVEPFGVDVCSGVRTDGQLDAEKLSRFFKNVMTA